MSNRELDRLLRAHLRGEEKLRTTLPAYLGAGFTRVIVGVSDRRVLMIKSAYWSIRDKGLIWADPLDEVALGTIARDLYTNGVYTGNTYVRLRRAGGSTLRVNPRSGFLGDHESTRRNFNSLYSAIPGRF